MNAESQSSSTPIALVIVAWVAVAVPLLWGIFQTLKKAAALFA